MGFFPLVGLVYRCSHIWLGVYQRSAKCAGYHRTLVLVVIPVLITGEYTLTAIWIQVMQFNSYGDRGEEAGYIKGFAY